MAFLSRSMTNPTLSRATRASAVTGTAAATAYPTAGRRRRQRPGPASRAVASADADNQGLGQDSGGQAVLLALGVAVDLRLDGIPAGRHPDGRRGEADDLAVSTAVPAPEVRGDGAPAEGALRREDHPVEDAVV